MRMFLVSSPIVSLIFLLNIWKAFFSNICNGWHEWEYSVEWDPNIDKVEMKINTWKLVWGEFIYSPSASDSTYSESLSRSLNYTTKAAKSLAGFPRPRRGHTMVINDNTHRNANSTC